MDHHQDNDDSTQQDQQTQHHVVVIGAGMAGLACARQLLEDWDQTTSTSTSSSPSPSSSSSPSPTLRVTLVEASDRVGGRIRAGDDDGEGHTLDVGAEVIHGQDHVLWKWLLDYQERGLLPTAPPLEPFFILSHADGGPQEAPTPQGKYGMYYVGGELVMYNDPKVTPLAETLEGVLEQEYEDVHTSFAEALLETQSKSQTFLSPELQDLCVAGYGNTAGCCDLRQLSMSQMLKFEHYWDTHEVEGDFRPPFGMHAIVDVTLEQLLLKQHDDDDSNNNNNSLFRLRLNCPVDKIQQTEDGQVRVACSNNNNNNNATTIFADAVVVTVPPPMLPKLLDLPERKQKALEHIGFERAVKVICKFNRQLWPCQVQSIVAANQPIPELWFQELLQKQPDEYSYVAVGFLVSTAADAFAERINQDGASNETKTKRAAQILMQQLSEMLDHLSIDDCVEAHVHTLVYDWKDDHPYIQGGYMYPKVGMKPADLHALAEPMGNSIYFAGEATNTNACCTVQAAMETGIRAAGQVQDALLRKKTGKPRERMADDAAS
jgi:monoamine oxidase